MYAGPERDTVHPGGAGVSGIDSATVATDRLGGAEGTVRDVAVVGAGVSGLAAAWRLRQSGIDVCVLEAAPVAGGCARTESRDGFLLEQGPFNVIVRSPAFVRLLDELAPHLTVVTADRAAKARFIYRRGRLHCLPADPLSLWRSSLLSFSAKLRLVTGMCASGRPQHADETVEQTGLRRFGREVTDTVLSAAVRGIYACDVADLSLRACAPRIAELDRTAASPIGRGARMALRRSRCGHAATDSSNPSRIRGLISMNQGMGQLTGTLARLLGGDLVTGCRVEHAFSTDNGYRLECRTADGNARTVAARRLVVALSAGDAARLLSDLVEPAAEVLRSIESVPMAVLNLAFARNDVGHPLRGYGFLVPRNEPDVPLLGVLWADSIFPHHAPPDRRLIRVFIGGTDAREALQRSDDALLGRAMDFLRPLLHITGGPVLVNVCRYAEAIPKYAPGHVERIARLRTAVANHPDLALVGNYLKGVSINDCIALADATAERLAGSAAAKGGAV